MIKKTLATVAAALGLLTVPVAAVATNVPAPAESRGVEQESPVAKTDGRHSRAWVPKGTRKRSKSRLTLAAKAFFDRRLPNRFIRRACAKAVLKGRGRAGEMTGQPTYVRYPKGQTTRRAVERARGRVHE